MDLKRSRKTKTMQGSPASPGTMEQGNLGGQVPVPPSTPSSRGRSGVANGGFERTVGTFAEGAAQAANVPQQGSWFGPYSSSGCQPGPYQNMGTFGAQTGVSSCFGSQPCFGGCGFPSQMNRGGCPVSGQREGRRDEGIGVHASVLQQISQLVGGRKD